jgi:uncharacterized protein YdhG (YjbR/CyaY superfamily)
MLKPINVDAYINSFPKETQQLLETLRATIKKAAPDAEEVISYSMPAYKQKGIVVYFAGRKNHIGLYPMASGIENFKEEITAYKTSRGTIQFQLDKPLPAKLITKIVKFRVSENKLKAKAKKRKL